MRGLHWWRETLPVRLFFCCGQDNGDTKLYHNTRSDEHLNDET